MITKEEKGWNVHKEKENCLFTLEVCHNNFVTCHGLMCYA